MKGQFAVLLTSVICSNSPLAPKSSAQALLTEKPGGFFEQSAATERHNALIRQKRWG